MRAEGPKSRGGRKEKKGAVEKNGTFSVKKARKQEICTKSRTQRQRRSGENRKCNGSHPQSENA